MSLALTQHVGFGAKRYQPLEMVVRTTDPPNNVSRFSSVGSYVAWLSNESEAEHVMFAPCIWIKLAVACLTNFASSGSTVVTNRVNGAPGNFSVTIPAGVSGVFTATGSSQFVAADDEVALAYQDTTPTGTRAFQIILLLEPSIPAFPMSTAPTLYAQYNEDTFIGIAGYVYESLSETFTERDVRVNGKLQRLQLIVTTNTRDADCVLLLRKNSTDTAIGVTIPAGAVGMFTDFTNVVDIREGDKICLLCRATGASGAITAYFACLSCVVESGYQEIASSYTISSISSGATRYFYPHGILLLSVFPPTANWVMLSNRRISRSRIFIRTNTIAVGDTLVSTVVDSLAGGQSLAIPAGLTGWFEMDGDDRITTNVVRLAYKIVAGSGGGTMAINHLVCNVDALN